MRRVVVTGMGMVTPLGVGLKPPWQRLIAGESGAGPITKFDPENYAAKIACEVPLGDGSDGTFNADDWMNPKDQRKVDDFIIFGSAAADMALDDAGWHPEDDESQLRTGCSVGAGIGGLPGIEEASIILHERGPRRVSLTLFPAD